MILIHPISNHFHSQAKSPVDAERGLLFMQEMMELSKQPTINVPTELQAVFYRNPDNSYEILLAGPSHFSPELRNEEALRQRLAYAQPFTLCAPLANKDALRDRVAVVLRGDCTFVEKARRAQAAGAWAVIVVDNLAASTSKDQPMFAMSGDGKDDVTIPVVFLYKLEADVLEEAHRLNPNMEVSGSGENNSMLNSVKGFKLIGLD